MPDLRALAAAASLLAAAAGCLDAAITQPRLIGEGRRVLFVGNSYLYSMDVPGIVQAMADSAGGDKLAIETVAGPNLALVDHWAEGTARREIAKGGWEWVVLQQGPSSTDVNRDTLRLGAQLFGSEMAKVGAKPVLFSAWPSAARPQDFPRAIESYALAAGDVGGTLAPVAAAWLGAWQREPSVLLYADGLHPSPEGAYLAAAVLYRTLLGKPAAGLPASLRLWNGAVLTLPPATAAMLQAAADSAVLSLP